MVRGRVRETCKSEYLVSDRREFDIAVISFENCFTIFTRPTFYTLSTVNVPTENNPKVVVRFLNECCGFSDTGS